MIASSAPAGNAGAKGKAPPAKAPAKVDPKAPPVAASKEEAQDEDMMPALPKVNFAQPLKYELS